MYPMRYDAILFNADEEDRNFHMFHLADGMLEDPENEEFTLADLQQAKRRKTSNSTSNLASPNLPPTHHPLSYSQPQQRTTRVW